MVDLGGLALPDDLALVQHDDAVGDLARARHVMGDRQRGRPQIAHPLDDQLVDHVAHDRVEAGCRLVEEDDLGLRRDGAGQSHALLHAAGQFGGEQVGDVGAQADLGQRVDGQPLGLGQLHAAALDQAERDVLPDGQGVEQRGPLEQHAELGQHPGAIGTAQMDGRLAIDQDLAAVWTQQAQDAFQQDGLAAAGAADDDDALALLDLQIDALQHLLAAEGLAQALDDDLGGHEKNTDVRR